ncbi:U3 snoRNP-associated protein-like EMB2271 [Selaginella moellendorffii]|uniref:U3 snoRNP-associated protein-like EMB2271 n=1 Tax=Selaginella moellendorffii TaxID=88036 RepID=UPI000D1D0CA3|nr:U3 snoRNP-associated protein-like EMB2271 [Selaginella moellendorffii]|eukprot:XP_024534000.1 U3 snoRNP-associated protein-like EMB2271 [Selaginella moellendorffii]
MGKRRAERKPGKSRAPSGDGTSARKKKKPQRSVAEDDFFDGASSEEENAAREEEVADDGEDLEETVHEKKVRLAKAYLEKLKAKAAEEEEDQGDEEVGEDERQGRRDSVVADLLRQEQLEESGKIQRKIASRLLLPEVPSEGNLLIRKHRLSVTALALTEDEKWGFSGSKDGLLLQWDVETGKCFRYERPKPEKSAEAGKKPSSSRILALAVDSSGRYLASGGPDRSVHLWDVRTQAHIQAFPGHRGAITSLAFRQGTTQLFSGSSDRTLKLWSAEDRSYMDTLFGHQSELVSVDCLRQERVLSAGRDRTLRLWKVPEETQLVFRGYTASIESCCCITNGEFLSGADDGSVALWSALRKKPVYIAKSAHGPKVEEHRNGETSLPASCGAIEAWVGAVATCRGSDLVASGAGDGKIQLWSVEDGNKSLKPLHTLPAKGFVNALAFARSGRFLLAGVGQEPRLGRWARNSQAKNGVLVHKLELASL